MDPRHGLLLAFVAILAIGFPRGDAVRGWLTVKLINIHGDRSGDELSMPAIGFLKNNEQLVNPDWQLPGQIAHELPAKEIPQSFLCDSCMDISTFMEQVLTDPDTTNNVLEYFNGSLCKNIPGFQSECRDLAKAYVPSVVETLQVYAAPNKLCGETNLCPSSAMLLMNDAKACKMCTSFASEALAYAQDSTTEAQVLQVLRDQCAKLGEFSSKCMLLVDIYGPIYFGKLDSTTPDEICERIGICSSRSLGDASTCATCEFAVFQIKVKLQNASVQERVLESLIDQCHKVPNYEHQCEEIVREYGPRFVANLNVYMNAETICSGIHACERRRQRSDDLVIELPGADDGIAHL